MATLSLINTRQLEAARDIPSKITPLILSSTRRRCYEKDKFHGEMLSPFLTPTYLLLGIEITEERVPDISP